MQVTCIALILAATFMDLIRSPQLVYGVVVERNMHTYFKLPSCAKAYALHEYHILQCPHKLEYVMKIPKPGDMPLCTIVGTYHEELPAKLPPYNRRSRPRSQLHTKVDYSHLVSHRPKKYSTKLHETSADPLIEIIHQFEEPKCVYSQPHATETSRKTIRDVDELIRSSLNPRQNLRKDRSAGGEVSREEMSDAHSKEEVEDFEDYSRESEMEDKESNDGHAKKDSPLKYLGAKDLLRKFTRISGRPIIPDIGDFSAESERFFSEDKEFQRGDSVKGYQNLFHRDEIYNDRIFYDDLNQQGNYRVHKKSHENKDN